MEAWRPRRMPAYHANLDLTMHAALNELSLVLSQPTPRMGFPAKSYHACTLSRLATGGKCMKTLSSKLPEKRLVRRAVAYIQPSFAQEV
jgi:hypothetical protein